MTSSPESAEHHADEENGWDDEEWEEDEPISEQRQRVDAAIELVEKNSSQGVPVLIGMLTDWDLDEDGSHELRAEVMSHLMHMEGAPAGAANWVLAEGGTAYELDIVLGYASYPPYKEGPVLTPQERRQRSIEVLELVVAAQGLAENVRWAAISEYLNLAGYTGYLSLTTLAPDIDVRAAASGYSSVPDELLSGLSTYVAQDSTHPMHLRIDIVERLWDDDPLGAGTAVAGVLRDVTTEGPELGTLLRALFQSDERRFHELMAELGENEDLRSARRFVSATLDSLDTADRLHPAGRIGRQLHAWVRGAVAERWGSRRDGSQSAYLDDDEVAFLTDLASRYHELRGDIAEPSGEPAVCDQLALPFEAELLPPEWRIFDMGPVPDFAVWQDGGVRAVVRVKPTPVPNTQSWQFAVADTRGHELSVFAGELCEREDNRFTVDFPVGLLDRSEWAHLLLQGLNSLSTYAGG
ncbi:hypothetical protein [Streptomyces diastatochromogenes]|uniref:hypothetical protein n=1 Tax=Streptomyces diastatochromogenes TaxID=42236 RepID=UPI0036C7FBA7